jgi:choline monooxygenase
MTQPNETCADLLGALDRGESLPARWYTDPSILEQEMLQVFRKSWNYVGPAAELAKVGDYVTGYAGNVPVVVVRNDKGLAGFVNVCRHRRHLVMKGRGNATLLQCGYHAWTYDLAGGLRRAPRSAGEPGFRLEDFPLLPIRVEALGPFVFVNLDLDAPAAKDCYGPILDIIAKSGVALDTLTLHSRGDWQARANWKAMLENYLECYHCAVAHPGFSAAIDVRPDVYTLASRLVLQPGRPGTAGGARGQGQGRALRRARRGGGIAVPLPMAQPHHQHQSGLPQPVGRCLAARRPECDPRLLRALFRPRRR